MAPAWVLAGLVSAAPVSGFVLNHGNADFEKYLDDFKRTYRSGTPEYAQRSKLFKRRVEQVRQQNSNPDRLWTASLNELADRTDDELKQLRGWRGNARDSRPSLLSRHVEKPISLPAELIWNNTTSAKSVRDQGPCGSCWAVATAAMLQARYEITMGEAPDFSAQELVNCVPNPKECGGQGGCRGATVELAMKYVSEYGLSTSQEVPYLAFDGHCMTKMSLASRSVGASAGNTLTGLAGLQTWETLPSNKAKPLMEALQTGPVAISAAASDWILYSSGIFDSCSKNAIIDHAIVLIGYGVEGKTNYWTVQNSWGAGWGENGFIRVKRHATIQEDDEYCGIDDKPEDGIECKPYPAKVTVCGMCGLLYDSVAPHFSSNTSSTSNASNTSHA
jgi:cathepsin L